MQSRKQIARVREREATMADVVVDTVVTPVKTFAKDSVRLINKCTKPDRKGEEETHGDDEEDRGEKGGGGGRSVWREGKDKM